MKKNAFTLVELLVVISIIAILSVIGITVFTGAQKSARDAKRKGDLRAMALALEQYKTANGTYPNLSAFSDQTGSTWAAFTTALTGYMATVPNDPKMGGTCCGADWYVYGYITLNSGAGFKLCANLENNSDSARNINPSSEACSAPFDNNRWGDVMIQNQQ